MITDLGVLPGGLRSVALGVNYNGQAVGRSEGPHDGFGFNRAFLWHDGVITDLGSMATAHHVAYGINDSGIVVGNILWGTAWVWDHASGMRDLSTLLDGTGSGWSGFIVYGINNSGQIVGSAWKDGHQHGVLLMPSSYALSITVVNPSWGQVRVEPDSPNYPPNTVVTLSATPIEGKTFKHWQLYDPSYPGDSNYAVPDSNLSTTIVMDADRQVTAVFKCGSGPVSLVVPLVLGVLSLFVLARRRQMA